MDHRRPTISLKWMLCIFILAIALAITHTDYDPTQTLPTGAVPSSSTISTASSSTESSTMDSIPDDSSFEVHFIDVGQADATLILCDNNAMLIDGGNVEDSSLIYSYLHKHNISHLDYIVCTHVHEDHVGGLSGALNYATVGIAYAPVNDYDSTAFKNFLKYLGQQRVEISIPNQGDTFQLGSASCLVLAVNTSSEINDTSIVLRIVYGETSFLFMADAEAPSEQAIIDAGYNLESTVLKVGHHGSDTSTSYVFLRAVMPDYSIISVGNNAYGHPTENVLSRLRDAGTTLYRTDLHGHIICTSDGKTVSFTTQKNSMDDVFGGIGNNSTATDSTDNSSEIQDCLCS